MIIKPILSGNSLQISQVGNLFWSLSVTWQPSRHLGHSSALSIVNIMELIQHLVVNEEYIKSALKNSGASFRIKLTVSVYFHRTIMGPLCQRSDVKEREGSVGSLILVRVMFFIIPILLHTHTHTKPPILQSFNTHVVLMAPNLWLESIMTPCFCPQAREHLLS